MVDFLRKTCGLEFTESEIFWVIGILRTNAFYIDDPQGPILQIFFTIENSLTLQGNHHCMAGLLRQLFGFNRTRESVVIVT